MIFYTFFRLISENICWQPWSNAPHAYYRTIETKTNENNRNNLRDFTYALSLSTQFEQTILPHSQKFGLSISLLKTHTHTLTHTTHTNSIYSVSLVSSIGLDFFCSIHSYLMQDLSQVSNFLLVRSVSVHIVISRHRSVKMYNCFYLHYC